MGRPTKLTEDLKKQIEFLAKKGFTQKELAEALLIDVSTITKWNQRYPEFFTSLKNWKAEADRKVERSLFERACGYEHPEDKVFNNNGEPLIVPTIKKYPPETTAAIFWLKNRKPAEWRDVKNMEHSGPEGQPIEVIKSDMDPKEAAKIYTQLLKGE